MRKVHTKHVLAVMPRSGEQLTRRDHEQFITGVPHRPLNDGWPGCEVWCVDQCVNPSFDGQPADRLVEYLDMRIDTSGLHTADNGSGRALGLTVYSITVPEWSKIAPIACMDVECDRCKVCKSVSFYKNLATTANMASRLEGREYLVRTTILVCIFTVVLTTNFIGIMSFITEGAPGATGRLPLYVLLTSVVFVAAIIILEMSQYDGRSVLTASVTAGVLGFIFISLGGEGLVYAWRNPDDVITSQLLVYFIAAAVIGTGLGYWGLRHWREFARQARY